MSMSNTASLTWSPIGFVAGEGANEWYALGANYAYHVTARIGGWIIGRARYGTGVFEQIGRPEKLEDAFAFAERVENLLTRAVA
jgi:hypothetical protein